MLPEGTSFRDSSTPMPTFRTSEAACRSRSTTPSSSGSRAAHGGGAAAQTAPRTLSETIAMVEDATKGKVAEIGLERRGGRHYYEVELVGAQDRDVLVDVRTGAITPLIGD